MKHKDDYTEEYTTNQLQAEETTRAKQDQQVKHEDFCTEGFTTNQLQAENTTPTKHDQQAKSEEFNTNQLQTEEFNTNQLQKEEKEKVETKALVRGDTVFLNNGIIPYRVVSLGFVGCGEVRVSSLSSPNMYEDGFWVARGSCRRLGGTT